MRRGVIAILPLLTASPTLASSTMDQLANGSLTTNALSVVIGLTLVSVAPSILISATSFVRIIVVLSLLRSGIGAPGTPPNIVLIALALFLTLFIMRPAIETAWSTGLEPYTAGKIKVEEAFVRASTPFSKFMMKNTRPEDLNLFSDLAKVGTRASTPPITVIAPAFLVSELRRAFEIGFLLMLPFLIIDLVVAAVLMGLGLMMLPPATISLPAKIIFFVLVDGWSLIATSLVKSFVAG